MLMRQTWRWFGPEDKVPLPHIRQAGVEGIVSALYHVPPGQVWEREEISRWQSLAENQPDGRSSGLKWEVVESLPVSEDIKTQSGDWRKHIANWTQSLENIAASGIEVVCYNFMPILDWTRTEHRLVLPHGGTAMSFDLINFAVFDIHLLKRAGAREAFPAAVTAEADRRFATMDDADKKTLIDAVVAGLAGAVESWTIETLEAALARYTHIDTERLRRNHYDFLEAVVPLAEKLGMRLCCHPDDPPFPLLGLPKIMSTEDDYRQMVEAVDSPANGITLCTGSLGSREDNDIAGMIERLGHRIHFVHLRNVTRYNQGVPCGFLEDDHLGGDVDMVAAVRALMTEQQRRRDQGCSDWQIPMRPDHGHDLLDDAQRGTRPGYPAIGRLKGLAELRGVMHALA
jgi:mannonate dehydratase